MPQFPASFVTLLLLLALQPLGQVSAQDPAASAPPAPQEQTVSWPSPWDKPDTRLVYDVKTVSERNRNTGSTVMSTQSVQTITPGATADGRSQNWNETGIRFEFSDGIPDEQRNLMTALARTFEGRPAVIQLNAEGNATGLANAAELLPMYQAALKLVGEQSVQAGLAGIADPAERAATEKRLRENMARSIATMGSEPVLVGSVLKVPGAYNFPGTGGMVAGETYAYEESAPNPFGGEPFPMVGEFVLAPPVVASPLELTWTLRMHPTKAAPILWALVEKLTGQPLAPEARKGLPESIDFSYLTRYRIDPGTGVVTWMERTETRKVMEIHDRTVTTMTLREGG